MNVEQLRELYEKESGERHWTNPVCHGEIGFASHKYQAWLENHILAASTPESQPSKELEREAEEWMGPNFKEAVQTIVDAVKGCWNKNFAYEDYVSNLRCVAASSYLAGASRRAVRLTDEDVEDVVNTAWNAGKKYDILDDDHPRLLMDKEALSNFARAVRDHYESKKEG